MLARYVRRRLQGAEFPHIREDDPQVRELRDVVRRMPDALEKSFKLSEDPSQCTAAHIAVSQYLRERGYDAEVTTALYTGRNYEAEGRFGSETSGRSRLYARLLGLSGLYRRNPKRFSADRATSPGEEDFIYRHLYLAMDCFVRVRLKGQEHEKGEYFIHAAYRQFLPQEERDKAPPIIFDRVDAYKLKKKYNLLVTSPEHVEKMRQAEKMIFSGEEPAEEGFQILRKHIRDRYGVFKAAMAA
jgi:hypothetical protein